MEAFYNGITYVQSQTDNIKQIMTTAISIHA
jgi:hypothetical protein